MTVYGYARVSTKKQSLERQITNIAGSYPEVKKIFTEKATGTRIDIRTEFQKVLKHLKKGDVLVLDSVSRFSRNSEEGFQLYQKLFNDGISLVFLKEPYINTDNYRKAMSIHLPEVNNESLKPLMEGIEKTLMLLAKDQFKQAFEQAEKEVSDLSVRTREGMKSKGASKKISQSRTGKKYVSKKKLEAINMIREYSQEFGGPLNDIKMIRMIGCSRASFYRYKQEAIEEEKENILLQQND